MPFRLEHITLAERIDVGCTLILHAGEYGLVTELAREYQTSRQFLYTVRDKTHASLETVLAAGQDGRPRRDQRLVVDHLAVERAVLVLNQVTHASVRAIQECLCQILQVDRSLGAVHAVLAEAATRARGLLVVPERPLDLLVEDFARYIYLPRLKDPAVLLAAIREGVSLLTWESDSFAFADSFDEDAGRYRGLRVAQSISPSDVDTPGLLVKPVVARRQLEAEAAKPPAIVPPPGPVDGGRERPIPPQRDDDPILPPKPILAQPTRFHGMVTLDPARVGRDASRIADEVIAHLSGLVGAKVRVTLEVEAEIPSGASDQVVRTVTENSRTLKFTSQGFEKE
jgi:hypothetical protein